MALFKPMMGNSSVLDLQPKQAGYAWFCVDDGSFHIDYVDASGKLQRKQINASIIMRLEALEKIIYSYPPMIEFDGAAALDAGLIVDTDASEYNILDLGVIVST